MAPRLRDVEAGCTAERRQRKTWARVVGGALFAAAVAAACMLTLRGGSRTVVAQLPLEHGNADAATDVVSR